MHADTSAISKLENSAESPLLVFDNISTSAPPSTNHLGLADLPTELCLDIFESLRPTFGWLRYDSRNSNSIWRFRDEITTHRQATRQYADLRLICSRLKDVLTRIIYREIVISISWVTRLDKLASAFECGAAHLHRLVIFGDENAHVHADAAAVIGHGLSLCSQVKAIECYGNHRTFTKRGWLGRTAPNLPSTVTSLIFLPNPNSMGIDLCYSLVALGAGLQSLEIHHWKSTFRFICHPTCLI
jgi:hypothetical protein